MAEIDAQKSKRSSGVSTKVIFAAAVAAAVWGPNPFERYFEAPPRTYRDFADVLTVAPAPRLKFAIKDALEQDGKLTQSNMKEIWQGFSEGEWDYDSAQLHAMDVNRLWAGLQSGQPDDKAPVQKA